MDDDEYYNQLTTQAKVRSLDDVASDVRKHLSGAVENIIKAGQALQEGREMHLSDNAFHDWCIQEFPDLNPKMRERMMQVGRRFGTTFMSHQFPITVLYELAAPSVPDEHQEALQYLVDKQDEEREIILLVLGRQLLEGRKPFEAEEGKLKNQRGYGEWITANFTNLSEIVHAKEVTAIIWAAEFPEQHQDMLDKHPRVRTTRGLYAKYKEERA